jgi:NACalpha-BTF3-like transcription factor
MKEMVTVDVEELKSIKEVMAELKDNEWLASSTVYSPGGMRMVGGKK